MSIIYFYSDSEPLPFRYLCPTRQVGPLPVPYGTSLSPSAYVEFAIADMASDSARGLINAFSNIKRSIHLLVDSLLNQYGLFVHFQSAHFPGKLQILDEIGLLPIGIMQNLNVERNSLEHEYSTPTKQRVTEAVDVAKLLLMAAEKLVEATPQEVLAGWRSPQRHCLLRLEPQRGTLELFRITARRRSYRKTHGIQYIVPRIRGFGGELNSSVKVSKVPWRCIRLDRGHKDEWEPIVKELVNLQRRSVSRKTFVAPNSSEVTIPVTIPISMPGDLSWSQLLDNQLNSRSSKIDKNKARSVDKGFDGDNQSGGQQQGESQFAKPEEQSEPRKQE